MDDKVEAVDHDPNNNNYETRQIYSYPGKTKSRVWEYFGFYKIKEGPPSKQTLDMQHAVCKICRKKYINKGNTTNFMTHIEHEHVGEDLGAMKKNHKKAQTSMTSYVNVASVGKISQERQEKIDDSLCKFIAGKAVPVSIVDNALFRLFIGLLDQRYKVPSRATVMSRLAKKKTEMDEKLKKDLSQTKSIAITHDGWTSLNTESFFTTTVHYIDGYWMLKSAVLGTIKVTGSHTGENIANELSATKMKWGLPKPIATTDNAANEQKAYHILNWERYGCYGHRINLVVKNALDIPEIGRILGKARKLVTFFHQSSSITDMYMAKQKLLFDGQPQQMNLIGHKLIIDVATRWNSTLYMLQRLIEQFPVLMSLANDPSLSKNASSTLKNCVFSFEEQSLIEKIVTILQPFEKATTLVCADKSPTIQKILPIVTKLMRIVEVKEYDEPPIKKMKERLQAEIDKRTCLDNITLLGCILNPFTKDLNFVEEQIQGNARRLLREELEIENLIRVRIKTEKDEETNENPPLPNLPVMEIDTVEEIAVIALEKDVEPKAKKIKSADMDEWLEDVVCTGEVMPNQELAAETEIQRYLGTQLAEKDYNLTVLEWWKENEQFFPRLNLLAKKYLAVPASSVSSERVFSLCGEIVNKKRCRLAPKNIDMLVFLNKNLDYW